MRISSGKVFNLKLAQAFTTLIVVVLFFLLPNPIYSGLESIAYDRLVVLSANQQVEKRIVLIDIDERSIAELGPWPWSRNTIAQLLSELIDKHQVSRIGIDIVFPEARPDDDKLVELLSNPIVVMSQVLDFSKDSKNHSGSLVTDTDMVEIQSDKNHSPPRITGYIANHPALINEKSKVGHISPIIDDDGKVRRVYPIACNDVGCNEMLSLKIYQSLLEPQNSKIKLDSHQLISIDPSNPEINNFSLPIDKHFAVMIPFHVQQGGFQYFSAAQILSQTQPIKSLQNAIVIIGSTALGLGDYVATPVNNMVPGLELHAQLLSGILDQDLIRPCNSFIAVFIPLLLIAGIFLLIDLRALKTKFIWISSMLLVTILLQLGLFNFLNIWMPISPPIITILILGLISILHDNVIINRQLSSMANQIGRFIPDTLVKRMIRGKHLSPESRLRELTVLVADMRGFTTATEGKTPEQVALLAQRCLEILSNQVYRFGGTIEKFSGDGLMAIWGAPSHDLNHAQNAFHACLAMQSEIEKNYQWFEQHGFPKMKVSLGINSGNIAVGIFGGDSRLMWSVHGDAVNVASRIEQLTRQVGEDILIGESTAKLIGEDKLRLVGTFAVKGRTQHVTVYSVRG